MVLDTLEVLIGQGDKDMAAKEEVVKRCWSQDLVHANLHAYFKLASNTIANRRRLTPRAAKGSGWTQATIRPHSSDPDPDTVPDPELESPQKCRRLSAGTIAEAATCMAIKATTAAAAVAARTEPVAAADMTAATTQEATTEVATAGRKIVTVLQRRTTTHLAASSEDAASRGADRTAHDICSLFCLLLIFLCTYNKV